MMGRVLIRKILKYKMRNEAIAIQTDSPISIIDEENIDMGIK